MITYPQQINKTNATLSRQAVHQQDNSLLQVSLLSQHPAVAASLAHQLDGIPGIQLQAIHSSSEAALSWHQHHEAAILFADAQILDAPLVHRLKLLSPGLQIMGFGKADHLDNKALQEAVFGYMKMPFMLDNILSSIYLVRAYNNNLQVQVQPKVKSYVFIKSEYKLIKINLADILFIGGMKDYIQVYLKGKAAPLTTLQNLKEFEKKLPQDDFIRVHRSYIVALQHVDCIAKNEIMIGNNSIPIGDAFRSALNGFIDAHS